jgi:hypothetical protein
METRYSQKVVGEEKEERLPMDTPYPVGGYVQRRNPLGPIRTSAAHYN